MVEIFGTSFNKSLSHPLPRPSTTTFNLTESREHARSKFARVYSLSIFHFRRGKKRNFPRCDRTRISKIGNIRVKESDDRIRFSILRLIFNLDRFTRVLTLDFVEENPRGS